MDLANMRANGVRCLIVRCYPCKREVTLQVDLLPDEVSVPDAKRFFRCSICGSRDVGTRPDWKTMVPRPKGTG